MGADKPVTPCNPPAKKPAIGPHFIPIWRANIHFGFNSLKATKASTMTASAFSKKTGLKIVRKYVPSAIPNTPAPANPQTSCLDFCDFLKDHPCHALDKRFGKEKIAIAVGTSNNKAKAGTATSGAPAPVAPFRMPPNPSDRNATMMGKISINENPSNTSLLWMFAVIWCAWSSVPFALLSDIYKYAAIKAFWGLQYGFNQDHPRGKRIQR